MYVSLTWTIDGKDYTFRFSSMLAAIQWMQNKVGTFTLDAKPY